MIFNKHSELEGRHAILSPSKHYWLNYDDEGLMRNYISSYATDIGTLVHEYACDRITYKMPLDAENDECKNGLLMHLLKNGIPFRAIDLDRLYFNLVPYVNDCIGYKMDSEIILKYSDLCFGTADAIGVRRNWLRIHDLKTGTSPASMDQLMCYAGLFFLEYKRDYRPQTMKIELRIYQNQEVLISHPNPDEIRQVMDKIVHGNAVLMKNLTEV
jgi:hypothetical protein